MQYPKSIIPEPMQSEVRAKLRQQPTHKLIEVYTLLHHIDEGPFLFPSIGHLHMLSAIREILFERGRADIIEKWQEKTPA